MKQHYSLKINGEVYETDAEPSESLLDVLRENLRLTGAKKGCNEAECGSCTVMLDGRPVVSCLVLIGDGTARPHLYVLPRLKMFCAGKSRRRSC